MPFPPFGPDIQWVEGFAANDKIFCVYRAKDEAVIRNVAALVVDLSRLQ